MKRNQKELKLVEKKVYKEQKNQIIQIADQDSIRNDVLLKRRMLWGGVGNFKKFQSRKQIQQTQLNNENILAKCPLCLDFIVGATITQCEHTFCERCLFDAYMIKPLCPICRSLIENQIFKHSHNLDNFILQLVKQQNDIRDTYYERVKIQEEWNELRKLRNIIIGQTIIVLGCDHKWYEGRVVDIQVDASDETILSVYYKTLMRAHQETIQIESFRLAKIEFIQTNKDNNSDDEQDVSVNFLTFFAIFPLLNITHGLQRLITLQIQRTSSDEESGEFLID